MFEKRSCPLSGAYELLPSVLGDERGRFIKTYHEPAFAELGLPFVLAEEFLTTSQHGVIRGLHFQSPPHDHIKVVCCVVGEVLDVLLDLRVGSPTYGQHARFFLSAERSTVLYIPPGIAHGFCVTGPGDATLLYKVSTPYAPAHDTGIRWDSAGIDWPISAPTLSERDRALPALSKFISPFRFHEEA